MILATNIQRFSLHDGPGIRTTVFLKGCSLSCPWCSNPENLKPFYESYIKNGVEGIYGKEYTDDEIFEEVMKDKNFYDLDGGVTFSGGEALLQAKEIVGLLRKFKDERITIAVETCLFVPSESLKLVIPYIDYFYVDMKIMDKAQCKQVLGGNLDLYKLNLKLLTDEKQIVVRVPVIGGYTDLPENRKLIIAEIKKYETSIIKVELIKEHHIGVSKYESLGRAIPVYLGVDDSLLEQYKKELEAVTNIPIEICKI